MPVGTRVAAPPEKALFLFDGDCAFCRWWVERWRSQTAARVDYAPWQETGGRFPEIPKEAFARASQLVLPDGRVVSGARAVFEALASTPGRGLGLSLYRRFPGFAPAAEAAYGLTARHRSLALTATRLLWGRRPQEESYRLSSALFLRLVAVCFLAAFVSLGVQVDGLVGPRGILPVGDFLSWVRSRTGAERYWLLPTLAWISGSAAFLRVLCGAGALAALASALGVAPALSLALCWALYLSLTVAGQVFLEFQWDALLLETGLLAIFLAPRSLLPRRGAAPPSRGVLLLLKWLAFRLMFSSGWVKLASADPSWRDLTALAHHFETQPLPPWTAWFVHRLPLRFHEASALILFAVELGVPFLFFAPRRLRLFAAGATLFLQALIAATGNYAFFNVLAAALALLLVDDAAFPLRRRTAAPAGAPSERRWPLPVLVPAAAGILVVSLLQMAATLRPRASFPSGLVALARLAAPFRSVNSYGLFAVMTTTRPEILVEGSVDGRRWRPYEFRWKPGDPRRRPRFVAPHQPRLDWQMWFAALSDPGANPWFVSFLERLREGSPEVLRLLADDPFPGKPPRFVRAVLYDYRFSTRAERRATGAWWVRRELGPYLPPLAAERRTGRRDPQRKTENGKRKTLRLQAGSWKPAAGSSSLTIRP